MLIFPILPVWLSFIQIQTVTFVLLFAILVINGEFHCERDYNLHLVYANGFLNVCESCHFGLVNK